jgi:2-oxoglutarate dehydrogenase E1 component
MKQDTYLYNAGFLDGLYEIFLRDPAQVEPGWRDCFEQLRAQAPGEGISRAPMAENADTRKQVAVLQLINAYRFRGHEVADLDPVRLKEKPEIPELTLEYHGLGEQDLDTLFNTGSLFVPPQLPLRDIFARLKHVYCATVGAEYMHLNDTVKKRWIQERLEDSRFAPTFDVACKREILDSLTAAEGLEHFLGEQYVGQKRFSLEGGESLIPMLDQIIQSAGGHKAEEVIIGMAHRGRLNVLVNVLGKKTRELFDEFEGRLHAKEGSGDVKYHQGYASDVMTPGGPVHIALAFNPSHLEIINPVVEGAARARQDRRGDKTHDSVLPVLIHGDAAFSGQGVVMETLNLSQTHGYKTGGTIHIIVNNQIGFTSSDPFDARSTLHCSDVAKMVRAPIFHVNGDDPEAVIFIANLALAYRMEFNMDVVIDMVCYRRHGHNEVDEPAATQPVMYRHIRQHPTTWTIYAEKLIKEGVMQAQDCEAMMHQYKASLKTQETVGRPRAPEFQHGVDWKRFRGKKWTEPAETAISPERLQRLAERLTAYPAHFVLHRSVEKVIEARREMAAGQQPADWGFAEHLAYASLLDEGYPIRLSGQDSGRGTFAHRHAVLHHHESGEMHIPLQYVSANQAPFLVINSLLSEEAVLGFEFGYSASEPDSLVIWEAQFGDFANGAQVVIDQFISSSEAKWQRFSGLTLFLPHGYDGQGPEHSSARLERYLQLCAENNIQVCIPSTPAQFFHLIRRQMLRAFRAPLIVMTPKSLLRHKQSVSPLEEFTASEGFRLLLDDARIEPAKTKRILFCSGQVYFKLLAERARLGMENVAIVRIEQLYPFPRAALAEILHRYEAYRPQCFWVQEEPRNQGAWQFVSARMPRSLNLDYAGRLASASPAAGYYETHRRQEQELLDQAFDLGYE